MGDKRYLHIESPRTMERLEVVGVLITDSHNVLHITLKRLEESSECLQVTVYNCRNWGDYSCKGKWDRILVARAIMCL